MTRTPCQTSAVDLWFSNEPDEIEAAINLCHTCPLEALCAHLGAQEPFGVWGGIPDKAQALEAGARGRSVVQPGEHHHKNVPSARRVQEQRDLRDSRERLQSLWKRGYSATEIGGLMGITVHAVESRMRRMRRQGWDLPKRNTGYAKAV